MPEHPHLEELAGHVRESRRRLEEMASRPPVQLQLKPGEKSWSALATAEHVRIMNAAYLGVLTQAIDAADKPARDEAFQPGFFARLFIKFVSPDPKFKVKTVSAAVPREGSGSIESLRQLIDQQDELLAVLDKADQVNLNKTKLTSPLSSLVKFTIGEALTVIVMHELRHLDQMERAMGVGR